MRHRWAWSWRSLWSFSRFERCRKCGALRKVRGRHWRYQYGRDWYREASACGGDKAKDDRQRELFEGEVKA